MQHFTVPVRHRQVSFHFTNPYVGSQCQYQWGTGRYHLISSVTSIAYKVCQSKGHEFLINLSKHVFDTCCWRQVKFYFGFNQLSGPGASLSRGCATGRTIAETTLTRETAIQVGFNQLPTHGSVLTSEIEERSPFNGHWTISE